jgi:hypothetical protein
MNAGTQDMLLLTASFLLILGGVAYWLYSFIEAQQRKLGVLENVLYELRFALQERRVTDDSHGVQLSNSPASGEAEETHVEKPDEEEKVVGIQRYVEPPESVAGEVEQSMKDFDLELPSVADEADELRPGGILDLNEDEVLKGWNTKKPTEESQFKKLFVGSVGDEGTVSASPLESMPTKQLRELAQERGLRVTKAMKKNELLEVLRSSAGPAAPQNVVRRLEEAE